MIRFILTECIAPDIYALVTAMIIFTINAKPPKETPPCKPKGS